MAEPKQEQQENRKKVRIRTGRRKAKKRVWKTKWVKSSGSPGPKAATASTAKSR